MAWRARLSRGMKELRLLHRPPPPAGCQTRFAHGALSSKPSVLMQGFGRVAPRVIGCYVPICKPHISFGFGYSYSTGLSNLPLISDPDVKAACKDLMAWSWDDIPSSVIKDVKKALSKDTEDKTGQKILANIFRAAEASEDFIAVLVNIRMALEERTGMTGENVTELPEELVNAMEVAYKRYIIYLNSFSEEETYLRKKVEAELGTRLIHLKQRVSGLGSEWGEINVIGTSGLSGSYVEQRAR